MAENKRPILLNNAKVFIDKQLVSDCVKCEIIFTPNVWTGKVLGEMTKSSRWNGYEITGEITRRRSTPWLKEVIKKYINSGVTPEFTIQGQMDDENSDYYETYGSDVVTITGCVLTGDLTLSNFDSDGDVLEDTIKFNAKSLA